MLNCENDLAELLENEEGTVHVSVTALRDQQQPPPPLPPPPPSSSPPARTSGGIGGIDDAANSHANQHADQQLLMELQRTSGKRPPPSSPAFAGEWPAPAPPPQGGAVRNVVLSCLFFVSMRCCSCLGLQMALFSQNHRFDPPAAASPSPSTGQYS